MAARTRIFSILHTDKETNQNKDFGNVVCPRCISGAGEREDNCVGTTHDRVQ